MCHPASSRHLLNPLSLVFLNVEKAGKKGLHCPIFFPNNVVTLAILNGAGGTYNGNNFHGHDRKSKHCLELISRKTVQSS